LNKVDFKEVVLSDTIMVPEGKKIDKIKVLSVAPLFAKAIKIIHDEKSISSLFL
ncbi:MAG: ribose-phosphate pyrophosphokinase, partial [Leptospiraceae bacterium]|nr:ribose-phosphate pyrophosphokinase [Leptospiraceae bacterium]